MEPDIFELGKRINIESSFVIGRCSTDECKKADKRILMISNDRHACPQTIGHGLKAFGTDLGVEPKQLLA